MDEKNYIQILEDSLESKIDLLRRLQVLCQEQAEILKDPNAMPEAFEENIEEKGKLIDRLSALDQGFDAFFAKVKDQLENNRDQYRDSIAHMQEMIREITQRSSNLQVLEKQNSNWQEPSSARSAPRPRRSARAVRLSILIIKI